MKWAMKLMITNKKVAIKAILLGLLFLIIYSIPFVHNNYQPVTKWNVYTSHYKKHKQILKNYEVLNSDLLDQLASNKISIQQYVEIYQLNAKNKKAELTAYFIKKKNIKKSYSFMGYSSKRYFLYAIGLPIFSLFIAILLLFSILNPNHVKAFKLFYSITVIGFIYVGCFWVLHSFLIKADFKSYLYNLSFVFLAIIATILIYLFVVLFSKRELKLKQGIKLLVSYISIELFKREPIKSKKDLLINNLNKFDELNDIIE